MSNAVKVLKVDRKAQTITLEAFGEVRDLPIRFSTTFNGKIRHYVDALGYQVRPGSKVWALSTNVWTEADGSDPRISETELILNRYRAAPVCWADKIPSTNRSASNASYNAPAPVEVREEPAVQAEPEDVTDTTDYTSPAFNADLKADTLVRQMIALRAVETVLNGDANPYEVSISGQPYLTREQIIQAPEYLIERRASLVRAIGSLFGETNPAAIAEAAARIEREEGVPVPSSLQIFVPANAVLSVEEDRRAPRFAEGDLVRKAGVKRVYVIALVTMIRHEQRGAYYELADRDGTARGGAYEDDLESALIETARAIESMTPEKAAKLGDFDNAMRALMEDSEAGGIEISPEDEAAMTAAKIEAAEAFMADDEPSGADPLEINGALMAVIDEALERGANITPGSDFVDYKGFTFSPYLMSGTKDEPGRIAWEIRDEPGDIVNGLRAPGLLGALDFVDSLLADADLAVQVHEASKGL